MKFSSSMHQDWLNDDASDFSVGVKWLGGSGGQIMLSFK